MVATKSKKKARATQLANFYNNVGTAWFVAGIITPFFLSVQPTSNTIIHAIIAVGMTMTSLQLSFIYSAK